MADWQIGKALSQKRQRQRTEEDDLVIAAWPMQPLELTVYKTLSALEKERALRAALREASALAPVDDPGRLLNSYVEHAARCIKAAR